MKTQKEVDFLDLANKRLKSHFDANSHNIQNSVSDLKFSIGIDQWDQKQQSDRTISKRPMLQINLLPKYINQVTGDERHNRPRGTIRPESSDADIDMAKIKEGKIRSIEYDSKAEAIYDYACKMQVAGGYGAWQITTEYTPDNPFIQEIFLERIPNPHTVVLPPDCKGMVYEDAEWGMLIHKISKDKYEEMFPDSPLPDQSQNIKTEQGYALEHWWDQDLIVVADYWIIEKEEKTLCLMNDGTILGKEEADEKISNAKKLHEAIALANPDAPQPELPEIKQEKKTEIPKVKHYVITASDIIKPEGKNSGERLKGEDVPGRYIPVVLIKGDELNIEGKTYVRSLISDAKDPQKLFNWWTTAAAEVIALAPKAPWIGTKTHFEGYEEDYARANIDNLPMLKYNIDELSPLSKPERTPMVQPPVAIFTEIDRSEKAIESTIGMFKADVGNVGPERTGAALIARQKPGDIGTFTFIDNLARGIQHSYDIILSMMPEIYDTKRDIRVRTQSGEDIYVPINTPIGDVLESIKNNPDKYVGMELKRLKALAKKGPNAILNDMSKGRYGVVVTVGPGYATQRMETSQLLTQFAMAMPKPMQSALDIMFKNMDFMGADELSERFAKMLPPGLRKPKEGESPTPPMPPPPIVQLQMAKVKIEEQKMAVQQAKLKVETIKALKELQDERGNIRSEILDILKEVHSPEMPPKPLRTS
jgi:hypothetical protein